MTWILYHLVVCPSCNGNALRGRRGSFTIWSNRNNPKTLNNLKPWARKHQIVKDTSAYPLALPLEVRGLNSGKWWPRGWTSPRFGEGPGFPGFLCGFLLRARTGRMASLHARRVPFGSEPSLLVLPLGYGLLSFKGRKSLPLPVTAFLLNRLQQGGS